MSFCRFVFERRGKRWQDCERRPRPKISRISLDPIHQRNEFENANTGPSRSPEEKRNKIWQRIEAVENVERNRNNKQKDGRDRSANPPSLTLPTTSSTFYLRQRWADEHGHLLSLPTRPQKNRATHVSPSPLKKGLVPVPHTVPRSPYQAKVPRYKTLLHLRSTLTLAWKSLQQRRREPGSVPARVPKASHDHGRRDRIG